MELLHLYPHYKSAVVAFADWSLTQGQKSRHWSQYQKQSISVLSLDFKRSFFQLSTGHNSNFTFLPVYATLKIGTSLYFDPNT